MTNYFMTDGMKTVPFEGGTWDFIDAVNSGTLKGDVLYSRVAAVFQAINKTSKAVSNVPFALVDIKSGEDYDVSWAWENKVKFLPRPKDLIRRVQQSIIMTNKGYLRMGKNVLSQPKALHFVIPDSIRINLDKTGDLKNLERVISGQTVTTYAPDDYSLMRFWWLDEKTELVPTDDTEFRAAMNAAEILYYADFFTANFYKRGGIKPTLIAMKGMVSKDKAQEEEQGWSKFLRGLGRQAVTNVARIFNADTMDVKPFGDGLGDLKETPVYKQALENVSMALGMPFSIMISNSANMATAEVENMQWHEDSIFPRVEFICDIFNDQLFANMGLRMEPRPENEEDGADEVARSQAFSGFGAAFAAYPDAETFIGAAEMLGYEIPEKMEASIEKYYSDKAARAETVAAQTNTPTSQPQDAPADAMPMEDAPPDIETPPAKSWTPTLDELNELRVWRDVALRRFKKGESLDFDYQPHYGGLPEGVVGLIKMGLKLSSVNENDIKNTFDASTNFGWNFSASAATKVNDFYKNSEILTLAEAINRLADKK